MKILNFKSEKDAEYKVVELTQQGLSFVTTGRTQLIVK